MLIGFFFFLILATLFLVRPMSNDGVPLWEKNNPYGSGPEEK